MMRKKKRRCSNNVSTRGRRWWERRKGDAAMTCLFLCSIHGAELKRRKCSNGVSMLSQYMWWRDITCQFWCRIHGKETKRKQRRKEGVAQPLCHACKVCHNHTKGCTVDSQYMWMDLVTTSKTQDKLYGLVVSDDTPADETTIITSKDDTIVIDELKS